MTRDIFRFGALFLFAFSLAFFSACTRQESVPSDGSAANDESVASSVDYSLAESLELTQLKSEKEFVDFYTSSEIAVVKFGADWCPPCRELTPELEKMAGYFQTQGARFAEANVDNLPELANRMRITSIPRVFVFYNKTLYSDVTGNYPGEIASLVNSLCRTESSSASGKSSDATSTEDDWIEDAIDESERASRARTETIEATSESKRKPTIYDDAEPLDAPELDSREAFDVFIKTNGIAVVKFGADWCYWCHVLEPDLKKLCGYLKAKGATIALAEIDSDKQTELAKEYGVSGIPHCVFFSKGKKFGEVVGCDPEKIFATLRVEIEEVYGIEIDDDIYDIDDADDAIDDIDDAIDDADDGVDDTDDAIDAIDDTDDAIDGIDDVIDDIGDALDDAVDDAFDEPDAE